MSSFVFPVYLATLVVLVLMYWAWRHSRQSQARYVARELSMTGDSESSACHQEGDVVFLANGAVLFMGSYQAFGDTEAIDLAEEHGISAHRESGPGKVLHIRRTDGKVHDYLYEGLLWYQLIPRSAQRESYLAACARYLRHRGLGALITLPQDYTKTILAIPIFIAIVAFVNGMAVHVSEFLLSLVFPSYAATAPVESPHVFTQQQTTSPPELIEPKVAGFVGSAAWTCDTLVIAGGPTLEFWDAQGATWIGAVDCPGELRENISFIAANPGQVAAVIEGELSLWDEALGWTSRPDPGPMIPPRPTGGPPKVTPKVALRSPPADIRKVCFSPDGRLLAALRGDEILGSVEILNACDLTHRATLQAKGLFVSVDFSADSRFLATATSAGQVQLWDITTYSLTATLDPPADPRGLAGPAGSVVAFSPAQGSSILVTGADDGIHFWDVASGTHSGKMDFSWGVQSLSFGPKGKLLAVLLQDGQYGELKIIDAASQAVLATAILSVSSFTATFSPDGAIVAVSGLYRIQLFRVSELLALSRGDLGGV